LDGFRVDMPHEGADVLNLPAPGAMAPYFTCEFDGRQKLTRLPDSLKTDERQEYELFAQTLQGPDFIFYLGYAFIIRIHFAGSPFGITKHQFPSKVSSGGARQGSFRRITANTAKGLK